MLEPHRVVTQLLVAETGTKLMHGRLDIAAAYALVPTQASSSSTASFGSTESAGACCSQVPHGMLCSPGHQTLQC